MSVLDTMTREAFIAVFNMHEANLTSMQTALTENLDKIADLTKALDSMWLLICTYLVFIMQLGFALLEAGSVRAMNTKNILMQNTLDTCISIVMYWAVGFGLSRATGEGGHNMGIGDMVFAATELPSAQYANFIFLWAFCNAATTIVSGAVTSRIKFFAYLCSCVLISGFTFPVVAYWVWSYGWLGWADPAGLQVIDFAGGLVVHMVGGFSGLMGALIVGPRTGRFRVNDSTGLVEDHRESGHSIVLATIGTFLLCFGWFGFNSGSTFGLAGGLYLVAANCAVNSLIAAGAAGLTIAAWSVLFSKVHDVWELLNGILCGLVAITPACATVDPWGAVLIGCGCILVYRGGVRFVAWCRIDDVVDAFAVHGCCGAFGTAATAVLSTQANIDRAFGAGKIVYNPATQLAHHLLAIVCVAAFVSACSAALFLAIKYTVGLRVSEADERVGLDFKYHAGYAYPDFNARVKKAHEQISMEAEIQAQVRKAIAQGKGARFKDAISMPASMFDSAAGMAAQAEAVAQGSGNKGGAPGSKNATPGAAPGSNNGAAAATAATPAPGSRSLRLNKGRAASHGGVLSGHTSAVGGASIHARSPSPPASTAHARDAGGAAGELHGLDPRRHSSDGDAAEVTAAPRGSVEGSAWAAGPQSKR